jgi:outer membrane protein insertion porin family
MTPRFAVPVLALLLLPGAAFARQAADKYQGRPIEAIRVVVENVPSSDPVLLDLIDVKVGQPLSTAAVRESMSHLYGLGRYQDVQVDASDAPAGGVHVTFNLIPLHSVRKVEFTGNLGLSSGLLRSTVTNRHGANPPLGRQADVIRTLEQLYQDHGYLRPQIRSASRTSHETESTVLVFEIDAGRQARIGNVEVPGDPLTPVPDFLRRVHATAGEPFQRSEIQRRLNEYVDQLKRRHYYEAIASLEARPSEDGTVVNVTIHVRPGPAVTVRFTGDPLPKNRLNDFVPVEREGSVAEDLVEDSIIRIEDFLKQQGYWKGTAKTEREESDGRLTLIFDVHNGAQYRVEEVEIQGNQAVPIEQLRPKVFLKEGDLFVEGRMTQSETAILDAYRQLGFRFAAIKSATNEVDSSATGNGLVRPVITIVEGPRTVVGDVAIKGNANLTEQDLRSRIRLQTGDVYYEPHILQYRDAIHLEYLNLGYASAEVIVSPRFSDDRRRADLTFEIQEGRQTLVDHILIIGNTHTNDRIIRRELRLQPGQPLGLQDQMESQRRLSALQLFRRVRITTLAPHRDSGKRDVLVTVEEAAATAIGYGGGAEATQVLRGTGPNGEAEPHLEFAPRGFFDIGRRNVGGKNRTVNLYTRVSLRPKDSPDDPAEDGTGLSLSEYRVVGTYRQPRVFGPNDLVATAAVEQGRRSSFNFTRQGLNADLLRRITNTIRVSGRYTFSTTRTFDERLSESDQAIIDRQFPRVRLSVFSGAVTRDTRNDLLDPERGTFLSAEGSIASRALGGEVGFVKSYMQGFWFQRLPGPRRIVFAIRAAAGLADGFARPATCDGEPCVIEDLPASERFFAGGDTTIRGFALDTVGSPETISANGFPRGGNAVLILNGELRVPVWRELGAAFFVDGGNVFERVTDFDFGELRGAAGFGVRYRSPLGPIRLDLGFKMDRREIGGRLEPRTALHFSIGQAF